MGAMRADGGELEILNTNSETVMRECTGCTIYNTSSSFGLQLLA